MNREQVKVFVVDDNSFCRALYSRHLYNIGFRDISVFSNGTECIEQLSAKPSLVLLDYDMDPVNGIDLLKNIKLHNSATRVLMVSGRDEIDLAVAAMKLGASGYILKNDDTLEMITKETDLILQPVA